MVDAGIPMARPGRSRLIDHPSFGDEVHESPFVLCELPFLLDDLQDRGLDKIFGIPSGSDRGRNMMA
jgi:hypothetical protein